MRSGRLTGAVITIAAALFVSLSTINRSDIKQVAGAAGLKSSLGQNRRCSFQPGPVAISSAFGYLTFRMWDSLDPEWMNFRRYAIRAMCEPNWVSWCAVWCMKAILFCDEAKLSERRHILPLPPRFFWLFVPMCFFSCCARTSFSPTPIIPVLCTWYDT